MNKSDNLADKYSSLHSHENFIELHFIKDLFIALGMCISVSIFAFLLEIINDMSQPRKRIMKTKVTRDIVQNPVKTQSVQEYLNNDSLFWYAR